MLKDALKGALSGTQDLQAREQAPAPSQSSLVESLSDSPWLRALQDQEVVPEDASLPKLIDLSFKIQKALKARGDKRGAKELQRLHKDAVAKLDKAAWAQVKARFKELELPEKSYRRLKQEGGDPHKLLARLNTRRAQEYAGASDKALRELLG
ncbi:MAG: hypothetical protein VX899_12705 [Myxococcota bacterium]|nr:hypothetical protein [Myxococcota bacterium]